MKETDVEFLQRMKREITYSRSVKGNFAVFTTADADHLHALAEAGRQTLQQLVEIEKIVYEPERKPEYGTSEYFLLQHIRAKLLPAPPSAPVLLEATQKDSLQDFLETTGRELGRRTNLLDSALADIKEAAQNELVANSRTINSLDFDEVQSGQRASGEGVDRSSSPLARKSLNNAILPEGQPQNEKEFRARYLNEWPIIDTSGEGDAAVRAVYESRPERDLPRAENRRGDTSGEGQ